MFALPNFMPRCKSINLFQNILKISCFCKKIQHFFVLGAPPPDRRASCIPRIANFWLHAGCFYCWYVILCKLILRLDGVYGFPQAALSWNKFAHPWTISMYFVLKRFEIVF